MRARTAASGHVYKRVDGNWVLSSTGLPAGVPVKAVCVDPSNPDTVYAGGEAGVYKSVDGGSTWAQSGPSGIEIVDIEVDPYNSTVVFAVSSDEAFKSTDGGANWSSVTTGSIHLNDIPNMAAYPHSPGSMVTGKRTGEIFRTDTAGEKWYLWNEGNTARKVNDVAFVKPQATSIFAATSDGVIMFDNSGPDLVVTSVNGPSSGGAGTIAEVTLSVRNVGAATSNMPFVWLYLSEDAVLDAGDIKPAVQVSIASMAPGEEHTFSYSRDLAGPGSYYYIAEADHYNEVAETEETNNWLAGNRVTTSPADLIVTSVSGPASAAPGDLVTVAVTVKNIGEGVAGESFIWVYLSEDTVLDAGDLTPSLQSITDFIAPGEERTFYHRRDIPAGGTYYYIGQIDHYNDVVEADETNNWLAGNQVVITQ